MIDFEKMEVDRLSLEAIDHCLDIVGNMPRDYSNLADQLQRAIASVSLNVYEGRSEFRPREKARFCRIALRAVSESFSIIQIGFRLKIVDHDRYRATYLLLTSMAKMITKLVIVGVDLGIKTFAMLSTGQILLAPRPHKALLKRLRKLSRALSRKAKGSHKRQKAKKNLACLHARISHIPEDVIHKATHYLVDNFGLIVLEDLHVAGMLRNRRLARSIADLGFGEFRRQIEVKALSCGVTVVVADRWFASSKLCLTCDCKHEALTLKDRSWICPNCGSEHERSLNAAKNLLKQYGKSTASSAGIDACGEDTLGGGFIANTGEGFVETGK